MTTHLERQITFMGSVDNCEGADVRLEHGVVLQLSRSTHGVWEVWAVKVEDSLYREPRDLTGEPLAEGNFRDWVEERYEEWQQAVRNEATRAA